MKTEKRKRGNEEIGKKEEEGREERKKGGRRGAPYAVSQVQI